MRVGVQTFKGRELVEETGPETQHSHMVRPPVRPPVRPSKSQTQMASSTFGTQSVSLSVTKRKKPEEI